MSVSQFRLDLLQQRGFLVVAASGDQRSRPTEGKLYHREGLSLWLAYLKRLPLFGNREPLVLRTTRSLTASRVLPSCPHPLESGNDCRTMPQNQFSPHNIPL
jgi:hypothetical protein